MSKEKAIDQFGAMKGIAPQVDKLREELNKISDELESIANELERIADEGANEVDEIDEYEGYK